MAVYPGGAPTATAKPVPTPRSVATQKPRARATPAAPPFAGYLTPAQQAAQVTAQITAAQLPAVQNLQAQQRQSAQQAAADKTTTAGYYQALAQLLKGIGPAVQGGYQQAAGAQDMFAKGFSDGLSHVQGQTGQEAQDVLRLSGGSAAQVPAANLGGTGATNALYELGGYIPASTLNREGAAFGAAAARLPATVGGVGGQQLTKIGAQQALDQQALRQKFSDLAAQIPGLRQTALSSIQSNQLQLAQQAQAEQDRQAALELSRAGVTGVYGGQPTLAAQKAEVAAGQAQQRIVQGQQRLTQADRRIGLTERGLALREKAAREKKKSGGITPATYAGLKKAAGKSADLYYWGKVVKNSDGTEDADRSISGIDYPTALSRLMSVYSLRRRDAEAILSDYYAPGERGRPAAHVGPVGDLGLQAVGPSG